MGNKTANINAKKHSLSHQLKMIGKGFYRK